MSSEILFSQVLAPPSESSMGSDCISGTVVSESEFVPSTKYSTSSESSLSEELQLQAKVTHHYNKVICACWLAFSSG